MTKLVILFFILMPPGNHVFGQEIPEMNFNQLEPYLQKDNDSTYVVNFWATWCKPCVKEIPDFLEAASELKREKVKFIFVSLDFPGQKASRLIPFVDQYNMHELVILLNDPDSNKWISKVHHEWSGAIPATLIYKGVDKSFLEKSLAKTELINIIKSK